MAASGAEVVATEARMTTDGIVVEKDTAFAVSVHKSIGHADEAGSSQHTSAGSNAVAAFQLEPASSPLVIPNPPDKQGEFVRHSVEVSVGHISAQQALASEITEVMTPTAAAPPATAATPSTVPLSPPITVDRSGIPTPVSEVTAQPATTGEEAAEAESSHASNAEAAGSTVGIKNAEQESPEAGSPAIPVSTESPSLQTLPKVAVDAAKQAGQAYVEAGKEARSTLKSLTTAFLNKPGPPITLTVDHIVTVIFFALLGVQLLLLPIFMPSVFRLVYSLLWGLLVGLGLSFIFYYNRKSKAEANELLSVNLGLKGLYTVAGGLPSWVNMSQAEKLEWLNSLIGEVWPYVDKGVCNMIKEITAKTMPGVLKTLPAGLGGIVKSIGFKHLTFGDAPFRVESIWVSPDDKESLVMELSVKWCGDPNITLAIEVPGGQKLCPRVMDISFVARVRVVLNPLVSRIPGFVALMATVPKPPLIKYRLDFGKALGGSMVPAAVTPVINFFLRDMITKMLVWPQRLVVPVLQATEQDKVEIQKLMRRHQGVLRVYVNSASELRPDSWGTNDVLVELTTDSEHYEATSIRRAKPELDNDGKVKEHLGESVAWRECIYLLIQEPKNQLLRLELFDVDRLRPTKLLTGQVSQVVNGRQLMGRSLIKLADVCQRGYAPGLTAPVGRGEWGSPGGPGKGQGKVSLAMTYWPFEKFTKYDVENAMTGIVTVRLLKVWGLAVAGDQVSAFVRITSSAKGSKPWRSTQKTWTKRGHILMLKREIDMLTVARERDLREGRRKEAERKTRYLEALGDAVKGNNKRARLTVELDYTLDSSAMHAIYHVKLTDVIKIKVLESSMLSSNECLGRLDVAVSDIVTANDFNPLTGRHEFGLHRRRWEEYNPEQPDRTIDQLERGLLLEEGDGARIWVEMRWVPCIQETGQSAKGGSGGADPASSQAPIAPATPDPVAAPLRRSTTNTGSQA